MIDVTYVIEQSLSRYAVESHNDWRKTAVRMAVYSKVKFDRGGGERRFSSISSIADGGR